MAGEHKVTVKEAPRNLPQYQWEGDCSCGFHTKQATEQNVNSQLIAHQAYHGVDVDEKPPEPKVVGTKKFGTWKPVGSK